ncbi:MAG: DNA polymerase/3'-5' exonuclease PolX [Planctomycetes bacterium]|nr:DNA polymerase/3'-5' exonuclease PolX [Planctomycetota bacterium]
MTNADIARVFEEIADLLEIKGADAFRVNSYRRVARTVGDLATDINEIAARGELGTLPGVGKATAAKIAELLTTGQLRMRQELAEEVPQAVLQLLEIPGLGPKKVALLFHDRHIASLADLKKALDTGGLEGLRGFGTKSVAQIRQGIAFLERSAGRTRLGVGWAIMQNLRNTLLGMEGVTRVEHAGSLRRGCETIGDLDLLCIAADGQRVVREFTRLPGVTQVLAAGHTKGSVLIEYQTGRTIQIDLRVAPRESFGAAWQYFTGSKEHNVRLRERAIKRGWSLNEYGLTAGERVIASQTEEEIYAALDLPCFPPELREDRGEFDLAEIPPNLLALEHIRGDLHMHTESSDGRCTIADLVTAAKKLGYQYICITDHSQSSTIANGLTPVRLKKLIADVRAVAAKTTGIAVLAGTEVDILADGKLDYSDKLLAELDFVIASIHSGMGKGSEENTRRTLAAIRNPYVNAIGHPTGRLIGRRKAMDLDIEAICKEAARTGTALEINASDWRLDLKDQHARLARELGAPLTVNTDAHDIDQLDEMIFGVLTARRAGLRKADVLNTWTAQRIGKFVQAKRP